MPKVLIKGASTIKVVNQGLIKKESKAVVPNKIKYLFRLLYGHDSPKIIEYPLPSHSPRCNLRFPYGKRHLAVVAEPEEFPYSVRPTVFFRNFLLRCEFYSKYFQENKPAYLAAPRQLPVSSLYQLLHRLELFIYDSVQASSKVQLFRAYYLKAIDLLGLSPADALLIYSLDPFEVVETASGRKKYPQSQSASKGYVVRGLCSECLRQGRLQPLRGRVSQEPRSVTRCPVCGTYIATTGKLLEWPKSKPL